MEQTRQVNQKRSLRIDWSNWGELTAHRMQMGKKIDSTRELRSWRFNLVLLTRISRVVPSPHGGRKVRGKEHSTPNESPIRKLSSNRRGIFRQAMEVLSESFTGEWAKLRSNRICQYILLKIICEFHTWSVMYNMYVQKSVLIFV